jgi:hypothetical protein
MTEEQAKNLAILRDVVRQELKAMAEAPRSRDPWVAAVIGMLKSRLNWLMVVVGGLLSTADTWVPIVTKEIIPALPAGLQGKLLPILAFIPVAVGWYFRLTTAQSVYEKGAKPKE